MGLYVLECDDSQANVLDNNDWDTNSPPATWTESLTCGATGDTSIYQGTRRNTHFKGMLPGLLCQENVFFIFLFLELGIHVIEDFKIISPPPKKKLACFFKLRFFPTFVFNFETMFIYIYSDSQKTVD